MVNLPALFRIWVSAGSLVWVFQEKMIFSPKPTPPDNALRLSDCEVSVKTENNYTLRGWRPLGNPTATKTDCDFLIYFGGRKDEMSFCAINNNKYFSCPQWYVNYRGYGQSDGSPSCEALRADALRIYDAAVQQWISCNNTAPKICVMGRSLGSHMAAHVAANRQIYKLIMVTPFDKFASAARASLPVLKIYPIESMLRHSFNTLADAPKIQAKTLFVLAERDDVVPSDSSQRLIDAWQAPHLVKKIPNTNHESQLETPNYWQEIAVFMANNSTIYALT